MNDRMLTIKKKKKKKKKCFLQKYFKHISLITMIYRLLQLIINSTKEVSFL